MKFRIQRSVHILYLLLGGICFLAGISSAQVSEEQARKLAKSETITNAHLQADRFLSTQRRDDLELLFSNVAGGVPGAVLFYKISNEGDEIRGNRVIHHLSMHAELNFVVAVSVASGTVFRVGGFADSLAEFNRLMMASRIEVRESKKVEAVVDFYLSCNPENVSFSILRSLLEFKQSVEKQCHENEGTFLSIDKAFNHWWTRHGMKYRQLKFETTIAPFHEGFRASFFTLSSTVKDWKCGAVPLQSNLEVSHLGIVKSITFSKSLI